MSEVLYQKCANCGLTYKLKTGGGINWHMTDRKGVHHFCGYDCMREFLWKQRRRSR